MNRRITALFAAFEGLAVVIIGVAIPLVPLTVLWGVQFGFGIDWTAFWRASVDLWLLGHGVDVTFVLDPATATALGVAGAEVPVTITIAILGFALLTVLLGVRAGRRIAETRYLRLGMLVSVLTVAVASGLATFSALHVMARPSLTQGTLLPTLVFALGLVIGVRRAAPDEAPRPLARWVESWAPAVRTAVVTSLRGGAAAAAAVVLAAALVTALAIAFSYAEIITLYEGLHTEVLGGIAVTLGQLALLPNIVIWAMSWLVGPGFALGTGSAVSPLGTSLGPIPAIPVLGALPSGDFTFGFIGLLVPVVAGFLAGALSAPSLRRRVEGLGVAAVGAGIGLTGGAVLGLLAWFSAGAAGPGRLVDVGPNPWAVGIVAAIVLGISSLLGLAASLRRPGPVTAAERTRPVKRPR